MSSRARGLVERALQEWPETRDNDMKLMLAVWYLQNSYYQDKFRRFFIDEAIHPETITRIRRKFQENGQYLSSTKVEEARFNRFKDMKNYGFADINLMEEVL